MTNIVLTVIAVYMCGGLVYAAVRWPQPENPTWDEAITYLKHGAAATAVWPLSEYRVRRPDRRNP